VFDGASAKAYIDGSLNNAVSAPAGVRNGGGTATACQDAPAGLSCTAISLSWNRALSDAEVKSLSDNPWQIFEPEEQIIWIPDLVSGGTTNASIATTDGADTSSATATAGSLTSATVAQTDSPDATSVTAANWTTAQAAAIDSADTTSVLGNIVGVTSAFVAQVDAADQCAIQSVVTTGAVVYATDGADSAVTAAANWTTSIMAMADGGDTSSVVGSLAGTAYWPTPAQVLAGVAYGPTGVDYLGTLSVGGGSIVVDAITMHTDPGMVMTINDEPTVVVYPDSRP